VKQAEQLRECRHGEHKPHRSRVDDEDGGGDPQCHGLDRGVIEVDITRHYRVHDDGLTQEDANRHDLDQASFVHDLSGHVAHQIEGDDHASKKEVSESHQEGVASYNAKNGQCRKGSSQDDRNEHFILHQ